MRRYRRILTPRGEASSCMACAESVEQKGASNLPDAHIIDLLDESRHQSFAAKPALLGLELLTLPANQVVVLNEE